MFTQETARSIRARVQCVTGIALPYEINVTAGTGLCVSLENGKAQIAAQDENALARGFFLLLPNILSADRRKHPGRSACR